MHPTRLHLHNGLLKFNIIGLPYNFKKLTKKSNFSGHISYSAPEFITEKPSFGVNSDTWSLGCCLYYLVTKKDPFEGKSIQETKNNILNLRLDTSDSLKFHDNILAQLIYTCLEREASKRMTCEEIMNYQDELEEQIFGVAVSKKHFDLQLR